VSACRPLGEGDDVAWLELVLALRVAQGRVPSDDEEPLLAAVLVVIGKAALARRKLVDRRADQRGAELRREAASAVARQQQLREELVAIRARAREIERQASRALARGEDMLGRQILARGMVTLKTRDSLEAELLRCRGDVARLLATMVRAENRAWSCRERERM